MQIEHLPAVLSADKLLLERAIMNVVNNALDYSPQDSSIFISMTGDKESLQISVTDAGLGFSQEDLLHAEEQFYMADRSRSSKPALLEWGCLLQNPLSNNMVVSLF